MAFALSLWIRWPAFASEAATPNLEASYHALWTAESLTGSPVSSHRLLPTVTLGPVPENDISWGTARPTPGGSYVYASFPPLAFWLATPLVGLGETPMDLRPLGLFNSLIGLLAALLLAGLARRVFLDRALVGGEHQEDRQTLGWGVFASTACTALLLCESLQSHGVVYWPQSPAQVVFIAGAWFAYGVVKQKSSNLTTTGLLACCAIYPLLEWSGYIFNVGLFIAFAAMNLRAGPAPLTGDGLRWWAPSSVRMIVRGWPIRIAALTVVVGVATLAHLVSAVGAGETLEALGSRAAARATSLNLLGLPLGYLTSLGLLVPAGVLAGWSSLRFMRGQWNSPFGWLLLITAFPSLENLIMLDHAIEFSFDRLKLIVPLILVLAFWAGGLATSRVLIVLPLAALAIIGSNVLLYRDRESQAASWVGVNESNQNLIEDAPPGLFDACAVVGASGNVRGYLNLLVGRDIYERMDAQSLAAKAKDRRACAAFIIETRPVLTDLPEVVTITPLELSPRTAPRSPPPRPRASPPA